MGRVLRQTRLHDDARRADLRADRRPRAAVLCRASAEGARLSLCCGAAARAAAARVAGARAQPLARTADSPPSRAVPVGLQPLQGAGGRAAAGCRVKGVALLTRIVVAGVWILRFLPLGLLAPIGSALGSLLYILGRERRKVCLTNLSRCLPEMTERERVALAKAHFRAFGRSVLERSILWWGSRERVMRLVRIVGLERVVALNGQPLILLAPHFVGLDAGCTRLTCEIDMAGIYAKQKNTFFDALLLSGRTRFGHQLAISRQEGVRPALAALKRGIPFYYLPDQDYGPRDAIFVPFFSASAATITGLSRMTRLTGARVLPCVTRMLPGGAGYELSCYPIWENFPSGDDAADARRMNAFIEERVREMPEQYFWTHKRFKTRPPGEAKWY